MIRLATWPSVSCISLTTTAISGAMPNQAKKHRKKANQLMWNARICGVRKSNRSMRVAFADGVVMGSLEEGVVEGKE